METEESNIKRIMLILLKDFSRAHTITSLARDLKLTRVGIWKILKKLESNKYINLKSVGSGKTNMYLMNINWDNIIVEKALVLYLTEEAAKQRRWRVNFADLEQEADFLVLYGSILKFPKEANDIDILSVAKKSRFVQIQKKVDRIQKTQSKKIHSINFTENEFKEELKKSNKAFIDSIKRGAVLFGHENFVRFIKKGEKWI